MSKKILIVDDDVVSRKNISQFLREEGYEVEEAASGNEAARLMEQNEFALVLLDLIMPEGNGLYVLNRARSAAPDTPVVVMSAFSDINLAEIAELGASDFIGKPLGLEALLRKVKGTLQLQS